MKCRSVFLCRNEGQVRRSSRGVGRVGNCHVYGACGQGWAACLSTLVHRRNGSYPCCPRLTWELECGQAWLSTFHNGSLIAMMSASQRRDWIEKREFQKKTAAALLKKLAVVCAGLGKNPDIAVLSRSNSSYFKLRCNGSQIQISVRETGELSYQLTDMPGSTDGRKIYYRYQEKDDFASIIKKFADDFGRLYKDFLMAETLHDFYSIELSHATDAGEELKGHEDYIRECV